MMANQHRHLNRALQLETVNGLEADGGAIFLRSVGSGGGGAHSPDHIRHV
jgi:hypothetical protein